MSDAEDQNAEPSSYRISQAREMGHIPLAGGLVKALTLAISIGLVAARGSALVHGFIDMLRETLQVLPMVVKSGMGATAVQAMITGHLLRIIEPLMVVVGGVLVSVVSIHQLTTGGSWTPSLALPKPARLLQFWAKFDDESGSSRPPLTHRILLGLAKPAAAAAGCLGVICAIQFQWFSDSLMDGDWSGSIVRNELFRGRSLLGKSLVFLMLPMIALGVLEMILNRGHWYDRLRPSADQARREIRELEGDPELKNRRKRLAQQIRESGRVEQLVSDAVMVVVGTGITGLSIQIVRLPTGKLAVGEVLRGAISARFAEKAAAAGRPWKRDAQLARFLVELSGRGPVELPTGLASVINSTINQTNNAGYAQRGN